MVWHSYLFQNFQQFVLIHTIKGFCVVNEADVFLEFSCFLYDPSNVGSLFSRSSAFYKPSLYISKFPVHVMLKPCLNDFEHKRTSMRNKCNFMVAWTFFAIAHPGDWNENWPFPSPVATAEFSKFADILNAALKQHHLIGFEITQLEFHHLH